MTTRRSFLAGGAALSVSLPILGTQFASAQDASPVASPEAIAPPQDLLPTDWGRVEGQTVSINGIDIYYETYGEGDPLLLLHGGLANGTYFANQIPAFAEQYQVIVMDSRGHGRSSFDDTPISYDLMSSDVLGLLDDYPTRSGYVITPVVIWGGGRLDLRPAPDEVVAVYRVGLHQLQRADSPRFITIPESPRPVVQIPLGHDLIHAPTGAVLLQLRWLGLEGRSDPVDELEQPVFAWQ